MAGMFKKKEEDKKKEAEMSSIDKSTTKPQLHVEKTNRKEGSTQPEAEGTELMTPRGRNRRRVTFTSLSSTRSESPEGSRTDFLPPSKRK